MRRGAKPAKARVGAKFRVARKARTDEGSRVHDLEKRLAESLEREKATGEVLQERTRALTEALEQQTATAEILRVISTSPTDLQPVLETVVKSAARFCAAYDAVILRLDGDVLHSVAHHGPISYIPGLVVPAIRGTVAGRSVLDRQTVQVADLQAEAEEFPASSTLGRELGHRTLLSVPLLREGVPIGAIVLRRTEVQPFTENQIALLKTFADQAVIAIENVRLFNETKEALDRQTATSEILGAISSSPTDVQPVFAAVVASAARLCDAFDAAIHLVDRDALRLVAHEGPIDADTIIPLTGTLSGRTINARGPIQVADMQAEAAEYPESSAFARRRGFRTILSVPLLRGTEAIGTITIRRTEVRPFTGRQVGLLKTFADQAVIAIENVRLFTELQEKNRALTQAHAQVTETLEQQTATSEILRVISSSPTDIQPVFNAIAHSAVRLCEAPFCTVFRFDGELLHFVAHHGLTPEGVEAIHQAYPMAPGRGSAAARSVLSGAVEHIPDVHADPDFQHGAIAKVITSRSYVAVPMLRDGVPIGSLVVVRSQGAEAFPDRHIELLKTFADQAVIAIENVRLFNELRTRTHELTRSVDQLTALGDVGRALSSTLDLDTVLRTIVARAVQLSGTDGGIIYEYDETGEIFHVRAAQQAAPEHLDALAATPLRLGEGALGRAAATGGPVEVADIRAEGAPVAPQVRHILLRLGYLSLLAVPLLREGRILGGLVVWRRDSGRFSADVVSLLQTFATQSALAIQNARLFREIADKSRQLEAASQHKSEFLANMSHELRTPLNAIIGFSEVLAEGMFGDVNEKQTEYLRDILESGQHLLSLINDILDLSKIEAGRMELELTEFDLPQAISNAITLVRERAGRRGIALHQAVDKRLGQIRGDERKIKQVLLNLLSNALKFTPEGGRVDVRAGIVDSLAEVSVTDTGVGIAPEDQEAVFEEFRQVGTSDKKVEGTGLGLALSRKFIELHGGRIWVKSQVGVGSSFTFTIPVRSGE